MIVSLSTNIDSDDCFTFEVRRSCILDDLLRGIKSKCFHPKKKINTWFVGESGRDTGGLTRELWCLFSREMASICDGKEHCKIPRHDAVKLQVHTYN